jgi:hypothetical protein
MLMASGEVSRGQGPDTAVPEEGWSGTATIRRHGSGPVGDGGTGVHQEDVTFTFRPDGTASYVAHYEWRVEVPEYPPLKAWGSESGEATWALGYVQAPGRGAGAWEVGVGSVRVPGTYDSTSVAQAVADWFVNALQAPERRQSMPTVLESDSRTIEGFADMVTGAATARSLSGGDTRTIQAYALQNLVPLTEQVIWSLTKGRVDPEPKVTIHGPPCGCLDADDPSATTLAFVAGATRRGGEFSEFTVTPTGVAPDVLTNDGGEAPRLELGATKETGPVTLAIAYELNGKHYRSQPFRVEFCAMKAVELEDNETDLAFDSISNVLTVKARQEAWYNGATASTRVKWDLEKINAPTTLRSEPQSAEGERITFTYTSLPQKNSDFGPKVLTSAITEGQCACTKKQTLRAFFDADSVGNPDGTVPNWYYYWKQTDAVTGAAKRVTMKYQSVIPTDPLTPASGTVAARWDGPTEELRLRTKGVDVRRHRGAMRLHEEADDSHVF